MCLGAFVRVWVWVWVSRREVCDEEFRDAIGRLRMHKKERNKTYLNLTFRNSMRGGAPTAELEQAGRARGTAFGASATDGASCKSLNMALMSISACLFSRYTVPRKLSGSESWNKRPLTMTRSPTDMVPV